MDRSIFPSDSAIWRITREHVLLLGGPAAAILQIAHPEVALGVARHSDFRHDALGRLLRTLRAVYTITFAPRSEVDAMAARVRQSHASVCGTTPRAYSAFSPEAQMWVLATLIHYSVELFEMFVKPVSDADREAFFHDMRIFGTCFGLPLEYGPQTWQDFHAYYKAMLADPSLGSEPVSAELARYIACPRRPRALRLLWPLSGCAARELLPSPVRDKLRLPSTPLSRIGFSALRKILPPLLPALPDAVRYAPLYLTARSRS